MSLSKSNSKVIEALPTRALEDIDLIPDTAERELSISSTTSISITSGEAPSKLMLILTMGESTSGI